MPSAGLTRRFRAGGGFEGSPIRPVKANRCSDHLFLARFVPLCPNRPRTEFSLFSLEPNFRLMGFQPNFLDWLISSAGVAGSVSWQKRGESVARYQVVCLPRVTRSKAFFADVADNGSVTNDTGSLAIVA